MCFKAEHTEGVNGRCVFKRWQRCFLLYILGVERPVLCIHTGPASPGPQLWVYSSIQGESKAAPSIADLNSRGIPGLFYG